MRFLTVTTLLQILQGLLTPLIAAIAVYIARQQWKTNEFKIFLDQYDRRLKVYQQVVAVLLLVLKDFKPEIFDLQKFRSETAEADFLFDSEIPEYLNEIFKHGVSLWTANYEHRDIFQPPPIPGTYGATVDQGKVVKEMAEERQWFTDQLAKDVAKQKFTKYLKHARRRFLR